RPLDHWDVAGVVVDHLPRIRDQTLELRRVLDRHEDVLVAPDDQRRAPDLAQPIPDRIARERLESPGEAILPGSADLLDDERARQAARMCRDQLEHHLPWPGPRH